MKPTGSWRRKRRIFLFFAAILVPASVLIILAVRVVHQESELAQKRAVEERQEALNQLRRELSARLQAIKLQEVNRIIDDSGPGLSPDSPIVFLTPLGQDHMVLPWEEKQDQPQRTPEFTRYQLEGESLEFRDNDASGAARSYAQALNAAGAPAQKCEAQMWIGRVFSKAGMMEEAVRTYHAMLDQCDAVTDDDDVPFALYAAERLITAGQDVAAAREYVIRNGGAARWWSPNEAYLIRSLLNAVSNDGDEEVSRKLASKIHDIEQIMALASDIHDRLGRLQFEFRSAPGDLSWMGYGDEPWLVTVMSPTSFAAPVVMAVSSAKVVPAGATLLSQRTSDSVPLGDGFVDLHVEWPAGRFASPRGAPASIYAAGVILILAATLLAAYLLLRDVQREVQMAEMRSHFVASVSHELKTPLTSIRMFAETLAMGRTTTSKATSEYLQTIVNESERLSRLVDNVLDFSRIEQGRKIYRMQSTCLADVVRSAAETMHYPLSQLGFKLTISIPDTVPSLQADGDALVQAILNLLANAMKYSGDSRQIELSLRHESGEAFIDVVDHGLGISREEQPRIFEKFYRVRSAETDRIAGTGLGLTLALHIVEAHNGRLEVASEAARGSTFSIRLPLQEPA